MSNVRWRRAAARRWGIWGGGSSTAMAVHGSEAPPAGRVLSPSAVDESDVFGSDLEDEIQHVREEFELDASELYFYVKLICGAHVNKFKDVAAAADLNKSIGDDIEAGKKKLNVLSQMLNL